MSDLTLQNNGYNTQAQNLKQTGAAPKVQPNLVQQDPMASQGVKSLTKENSLVVRPQTQLVSRDEILKYNAILAGLTSNNRAKLNELLKTGRLLDKKNSNDGSSALDNLYKMIKDPRVRGLDAKVVLNETVNTLHNPFVITQKFGDIPKKYRNQIISSENAYRASKNSEYEEKITASDLDVRSNCCVAASIEFNMAHRAPAEFARIAEQLTSPKNSVTKVIDTKAIAMNYIDAMILLKEFKANPKYLGLDKVQLELAPDRNAIIRARIQNSYKDKNERSVIDVLIQSTLMNIGSAKTYNSLTDARKGQFDRGLANIEKSYAECISTGKNKILVNYQIIDDELNLVGHECPFEEIKTHITDSLNIGENVIIGYTYLEKDGKVNPDGHEITIIGIEKDKSGKEYFVCKDTDSNSQAPVKYEVNDFLPKIHHAGIPKSVLDGKVKFVETWEEHLAQYQRSRKEGAKQLSA